MVILAFVRESYDVEIAAKFKHIKSWSFIALGAGAITELIKRSIPFETYSDFFTELDYSSMNEKAAEFMQRWYKPNYTNVEGFKIGDFYIGLYNIFSEPIRELCLIEKAISKRTPQSIYLFNPEGFMIKCIRQIISKTNLKVNIINRTSPLSLFNLLRNYLAREGKQDFRHIIMQRFLRRPDKRLSRPVASYTVFNLFRSFYLVSKNLRLNGFFERIIPKITPKIVPKYYQIQRKLSSKKPTHPQPLKILFLCSFINSVTTLAPIVYELLKEGHEPKCIVTHPDGLLKCEEMKLPYETVGNYLTGDIQEQIEQYDRRLKQEWLSYVKTEKTGEIFRFQNNNLFPSVRPGLFLLYNVAFEYGTALTILYHRILKVEEPDVIVSGDDVGFAGRAFIRVGNKMKIPSLTVQHSTIDDIYRYKWLVASKMAVWGQNSLQRLVDAGVPSNKLVITGSPRFDMLINKDERVTKNIYSKMGINFTDPIALWTPSPYTGITTSDSPEINTDSLEILSNVLTEFPNIQFVIKLHPLDKEQIYTDKLKALGDFRTIVTTDIDVYDLLYASSFLLVCNSTTGIEAMLYDKPIIVTNFHNIPENVPYVELGAAIRATNSQELTSAIQSIIDGDELLLENLSNSRSEFLEQYAFKIDGCSSNRITKLLKILAKKV